MFGKILPEGGWNSRIPIPFSDEQLQSKQEMKRKMNDNKERIKTINALIDVAESLDNMKDEYKPTAPPPMSENPESYRKIQKISGKPDLVLCMHCWRNLVTAGFAFYNFNLVIIACSCQVDHDDCREDCEDCNEDISRMHGSHSQTDTTEEFSSDDDNYDYNMYDETKNHVLNKL